MAYACFPLVALLPYSTTVLAPTCTTHASTYNTHKTSHAYHFTAIDCTSFDWSSSWLKIALQILLIAAGCGGIMGSTVVKSHVGREANV